jgi:dTDP-4-dehydrorhamnose reductase
MAFLLIGARGQLGTDLLSKNRELFLPWTSDEINLLNLQELEKKLESLPCEGIINCAAYNKTELAEEETLLAYTINGHAVGVMAKVAHGRNIPLFHVSTDYVFDGKKETPYQEGDLTAPLSIYGASKALGESLALSLHPGAYVLRTASLYGLQGSREKKGNFVDSIVQKGEKSDPIRVIDDIWMSPTATSDLADMILKMIEDKTAPGLYHAVNSGEASWFTFAQEIGKKMGFFDRIEPVSKSVFPSKIRRPTYSVLSNEKLAKKIPLRPWQEALTDYLSKKFLVCEKY